MGPREAVAREPGNENVQRELEKETTQASNAVAAGNQATKKQNASFEKKIAATAARWATWRLCVQHASKMGGIGHIRTTVRLPPPQTQQPHHKP